MSDVLVDIDLGETREYFEEAPETRKEKCIRWSCIVFQVMFGAGILIGMFVCFLLFLGAHD